MKKTKVLFVYYKMMLGGSTTSLLSLLESIDYSRYDVDLLLYKNEGPFMDYIPQNVNLLPQAFIYTNKIKKILKSILSGSLPKACLQSYKYTKQFKPAIQSSAYMQLSFCRKIDTEYDVAIGFMELWSDVFVNERIKAKKKISWIHIDYEKAHMFPDIDRKMLAKSDAIVTVSEECRKNLCALFPELKQRCYFIENILTKKYILNRIRHDVHVDRPTLSDDNFNLLSVCRLAIFHKGLDRGIQAVSRLVEEGYKIAWYIAGDGQDEKRIIDLIHQYGLEKNVFLLGKLDCPYPLFSDFDLFFLPSRYEGKPMAVTEAMMLELPPLVAEYASAHEQIQHNKDGYITENSDEGIYNGLKYLITNKDLISVYRNNLASNNYDNKEEIEKIYKLFD